MPENHGPFGMRRLTALVGRMSSPLDYSLPGTVPPDDEPGPVDVIVPVYGAPEELRRCLASLHRHTQAAHRVLLVIDGPQPTAVEEVLDEMQASAAGSLLVVRNPERRGFVGSVNRGMGESQRDVVLLNSDTEVVTGWLGRLQAAAYSSPAVATVTPFSNNATLVSLPRPFEANAIPAGHDVDSFAAVVERASRREYPRIPTGVGLCLYIKRKALDALGLFDEARFGFGYGEENDFCLRALAAGYIHVLDDATFIFHAGQRSFGASGPKRVRQAQSRLARIHPAYLPTIARFMKDDPLRPARERVIAALAPPSASRSGAGPARVVHVVQGWPPFNHAGTETYARGLAVRQAGWRPVSVHARLEDRSRTLGEATELHDHGIRARLVVNNFTQRDPLSRNALRNRVLERDFARFLDNEKPALVHVHHLAGHSLGLLRAIAARRLPLVLQVQDWWLVCARANLSMADRSLCPGPSIGRCARCMPLTGVPPAGLLSRLLHARRRSLAHRWVRRADALVMGSEFIAQSLQTVGLLSPAAPVHVIPYGIERSPRPRADSGPGRPLRFGFLGAIMPHKGVHVAVAAFRDLDPSLATLDVVGDLGALPSYTGELRAMASPAVSLSGSVPEEEKARRLSGFDVLIVPSLGLESFGLAAREAMSLGVPVLASRRGALTEAFEDGVCGAYFEAGDAAALRAWVDRLCARPEIVAEWSRRLPAVKTMDAHAEEMEAVYESVLAARSRR
jgi:glycosyltransferase involved in cell wall biosynthesis/GT2 family glycosyltransferase